MHEKLDKLFTERAKPRHCSRADAQGAVAPLLQHAAALQRQLAEYRAILIEAETSPDLPPLFYGKIEFLHQSLAAGERAASELVRVGREAIAIHNQIGRILDEAKVDMEADDERHQKLMIVAARQGTLPPTT